MSKYAQGKYNLKNPEKYIGQKTPTYRSSWEFLFCKFCDEHPSIIHWASEAVKIPYRDPLTGRQTVYVPDFFIVYLDKTGKQHAEIVEIKPAKQQIKEKVGRNQRDQTQYVKNLAKWEAARAWCKQKNLTFRVVNENDMFHQGKKR